VAGMAENLERAAEVEGVKAIVKEKEDLDWLGFLDCTHFDGIDVIGYG
jgi:hypothetical protein